MYFAAELRILLVYLSESLGRLGQNGGPLGGHIFHWGRPPWSPVEPLLPIVTILRVSMWSVIDVIKSSIIIIIMIHQHIRRACTIRPIFQAICNTGDAYRYTVRDTHTHT